MTLLFIGRQLAVDVVMSLWVFQESQIKGCKHQDNADVHYQPFPESILKEKKADLIGLARMLWVDPDWPRKARQGRDRSIIKCSPKCDACLQLVMQGKPAFCPRWEKEKRAEYKTLFR